MDGRQPTDAEVEGAVHQLTLIAHASQWERIAAIGKLILSRFFGNDETAWQARRRNKDQSIRSIARHFSLARRIASFSPASRHCSKEVLSAVPDSQKAVS